MKTRISKATVVLPHETLKTSVIIEDGQIAAIDPAVHTHSDITIPANGFHLLPGIIDDQVHFREPGFEHKEDLTTGSRACAKGGVTTFFEMPNTNPATTTCELLHSKLALASTKSIVNYAFFIGATPDNIDELKSARRTPGIKIFIGSSTGQLLVDEQEALERIFAETTLPITAHCEDESTVRANQQKYADSTNVSDHSNIRNHDAAIIATKRALDLANRHRHQFHVLHVSTGAEVQLLRDRPSWVTAEACPHHLFFNRSDYERLGTRVQMNPSIKDEHDNEMIWQGLLDGDIQIIATDHAPHTLEEKNRPFPASPSGMPAVENSLALMLDQVNKGRCTLEQVVRWMSYSPAEIWHVANKGRIEVGYDADLVLVDLAKEYTIRDEEQVTKCGWSAWHGTKLRGWPVRTWVMGTEVYRDGKIFGKTMGHEVQFSLNRGSQLI